MKILLVNVTCNQGSTGKITYDIYNEYKSSGHDVKICYGRGNLFDNPDIIKISTKISVNMHGLKTRLTGIVGRGNKRATLKLLSIIEDFKPDIVHLHNIHGYYIDTYKLLAYLKVNGIQTVLTMHDEWIFTGKCGYSYDCPKWQDNCGNCPQLKEYPKSLFFDQSAAELNTKRTILKDSHNITYAPVATWLMEKAQQSDYLKDKYFKVVHNGINLDVFNPQDTSVLKAKHQDFIGDNKIILHVTPNFHDPRKGFKYVVELAEAMKAEKVKFIAIGVPSEEISKLPSNILGISRTENQKVLAEYYSFADLFLITSEMECLPTVVVESICCGTPVIGFDRGGAKEAAPGNMSQLVEYPNVIALRAAALDVLFGNNILADKGVCAQYGKESYAKSLMAENYLQTYSKLMEMR